MSPNKLIISPNYSYFYLHNDSHIYQKPTHNNIINLRKKVEIRLPKP